MNDPICRRTARIAVVRSSFTIGATAEAAATGADPNLVKGSPRKPTYPIRPPLASYLIRFRRELALPVSYERLGAFRESKETRDEFLSLARK